MDDVILALAILMVLSFYFLPTFVAQIRNLKSPATIFSVNLIFGWTVVGWIAALIWAVRQGPRSEGDTASSCPVRAQADVWIFDPPNLTELVEQDDNWVFSPEHFVESPHNR